MIYWACPKRQGLVRDLNPGPLAPKARIIPLDQRASIEINSASVIAIFRYLQEGTHPSQK